MEIDRERGYGEIGYWVAADARGRGIATRATRLLADWARDELGLTRIEILPHKDNAPSRRVAEKLGFRDTGALVGAPPRGPRGRARVRRLRVGGMTERRRRAGHAGSIRPR